MTKSGDQASSGEAKPLVCLVKLTVPVPTRADKLSWAALGEKKVVSHKRREERALSSNKCCGAFPSSSNMEFSISLSLFSLFSHLVHLVCILSLIFTVFLHFIHSAPRSLSLSSYPFIFFYTSLLRL